VTSFSALPRDCKFALLGLTRARADVPNAGVSLADGTQVLTRFPIELNSEWQSWLGIEASHVSDANLVFARTATKGFAPETLTISDDGSWVLAKQAENLLSMLRLLGTIEYERSFLVMGYIQSGQAVCQQFAKLGQYDSTRGCLPWMIREEHLATAADLSRAKSTLLARFPDARKVRIFRGWFALTSALQQLYASDRIHGFARALEALIYPEISRTERQFVHRCSLFAAPNTKKGTAQEALQEAYRMRSDVEHLHEWDRSLATYGVSDREDIAYWRTRQMESLACMAYAKIFRDIALQQHFFTDTAIGQFWGKPEHEIRSAFGVVCDITELKVVKSYDSWGRAKAPDWPVRWDQTLKRKFDVGVGDSFRALGAGV